MKIVTRNRWLGACAFAGALLLAACGASTTPASTSAPAAAATAAPAAAATAAPAAAATAPAATAAPVAAAPAKLNLNEVTADQLLSAIPGFGNRMVREFMEYRPYTSIQQFRREIGKYVDQAQVAEYEKYVYVPVNVNEADAATLQQISGVESATADSLIAARPYANNAAFIAKLKELAPGADTAQAEAFLAVQ